MVDEKSVGKSYLHRILYLDTVLEAIWNYEVISRDIHLDPFQTTPIYEAVLQLQEYYIELDRIARGL